MMLAEALTVCFSGQGFNYHFQGACNRTQNDKCVAHLKIGNRILKNWKVILNNWNIVLNHWNMVLKNLSDFALCRYTMSCT